MRRLTLRCLALRFSMASRRRVAEEGAWPSFLLNFFLHFLFQSCNVIHCSALVAIFHNIEVAGW